MNNKSIVEWLNTGKSYWHGVELYKQLGHNNFLKKVLAKEKTAYNKKRLQEALTDLLKLSTEDMGLTVEFKNSSPKPPENINLSKPTHFDRSAELEHDSFFKYPLELQKIIIKRKELYKQMGPLHERKAVCSYKERQRIIPELMQLFNQSQELWEEINYYDIHGHIKPKVADVPDFDIAELTDAAKLNLLNNIRSYISKNKSIEALLQIPEDKLTEKQNKKVLVYKTKLKQKEALELWKESFV